MGALAQLFAAAGCSRLIFPMKRTQLTCVSLACFSVNVAPIVSPTAGSCPLKEVLARPRQRVFHHDSVKKLSTGHFNMLQLRMRQTEWQKTPVETFELRSHGVIARLCERAEEAATKETHNSSPSKLSPRTFESGPQSPDWTAQANLMQSFSRSCEFNYPEVKASTVSKNAAGASGIPELFQANLVTPELPHVKQNQPRLHMLNLLIISLDAIRPRHTSQVFSQSTHCQPCIRNT